MPSFQKDPFRTPFGVNEFLRSTRGMKTVSRTCAKNSIPTQTIDGWPNQKILPFGMAIAKIITGPDAGKVGPFQALGVDEIQTLTGGGTISGGTFTITLLDSTTAPIAWDATAAAVQTAIRTAVAASLVATDAEKAIGRGLTVTGGPIATVPFVITYNGDIGLDVAQATVDVTALTGAGHAITPTTGTPGSPGATDGRGDVNNLVGLNNTFLPWQLMDRDVEIAVLYTCDVYQDRCLMLNSAGIAVPLDDTTAAAMVAKKFMNITFAV